MSEETMVDRAELVGDFLLPITLEVELERPWEERSRREVIRCHYYHFTADTSLDVFVIEAGRLVRKSSYNAVLTVKEIYLEEARA